jgi:RNA polymerase sigma-70 factor (ECF subfamily)
MATALYALSADESPRVSVTPTEDDADLVGRALLGDRTAEALIYRRHARAIAGLAARLSGSRSDAEDIVQETFVRALEHLRDLRDPNALRPWLTRIAVTCAQRRLRRKKFLGWFGVGAGDEDLAFDALVAPDASPEVRAELARVASVLSCSPESERVAWVLHRVEGETLESVAEACECSLATAKRRIAAVEARLEKHLCTREPPR